MTFKHLTLAAVLAVSAPTFAFAQGTIPGAERGIRDGDAAAGPIGGIVGGAVGAAAGTVGGVLGVPAGDPGCSSTTTRRSDAYGNSETTRRSDCP